MDLNNGRSRRQARVRQGGVRFVPPALAHCRAHRRRVRLHRVRRVRQLRSSGRIQSMTH